MAVRGRTGSVGRGADLPALRIGRLRDLMSRSDQEKARMCLSALLLIDDRRSLVMDDQHQSTMFQRLSRVPSIM